MSQSISLVSLARQILEAAEKLEQAKPGSITEQEHIESRNAIVSATYDLRTQVFTGAQLVENHLVGYHTMSCLAWLVHFNIFTHVPIPTSSSGDMSEKVVSYAELSTRAGVPLSRLQSVARTAMTSGLFRETEDGSSIFHTDLSAEFARDISLRDWVKFITVYLSPTASKMAEATARWGDTDVKHHTAFNIALATDHPFFDYLKVTPGLADEFAGYMRALSCSEALNLKHLVDGFGWGGLGRDAVVVDVGGSTAQASIAVAKRFPDLRFIVEDLPEVVVAGPGIVAEAEEATPSREGRQLSSRITFVEHDFFNPQPKLHVNGDVAVPSVYLLRRILHDWPTARAREILQQLAVALRDGQNPQARIVIMDTILPPVGTLGPHEEAKLRVRDLAMAQIFNSQERELSEWKELLESTEPKLMIKAWRNPVGSSLAVIEAGL
ncbi:S-adenosyl-L-methionine-dependent methyltransferase [Periconia macrospinosa]|uniref:S-adenosyl-L-methionine-dependent methyltransferase n=1 Tax=Periconia macrospinosa TaxID=97972 RepID=A0A2V1DYS1_9PLEO|nr:S-adenosyl-L-methionine-dependent methyltransferase [Periconia macrospinosa]